MWWRAGAHEKERSSGIHPSIPLHSNDSVMIPQSCAAVAFSLPSPSLSCYRRRRRRARSCCGHTRGRPATKSTKCPYIFFLVGPVFIIINRRTLTLTNDRAARSRKRLARLSALRHITNPSATLMTETTRQLTVSHLFILLFSSSSSSSSVLCLCLSTGG